MAKGQKELPTLERKAIGEIESAAEDFEEASAAAKKATEKKKEAGELLISRMRSHKLLHYRFGDTMVTVDPKASVKVKNVEDQDFDVLS